MILAIIIILFLVNLTDYYFLRIPNFLSLILFIYSITFILWDEIYINVIGAIIGIVIFVVGYLLSRRSLGEGDIKIIPSLGLIVGYPGIFFLILNASVLSIFFFILNKKRKTQVLPFAPFLTVSLLIIIILQSCSF